MGRPQDQGLELGSLSSYNSTTSPAKLQRGHATVPDPRHVLHTGPRSPASKLLISVFCNHPEAHAALSFRFFILTHNCVFWSQADIINTKVSFLSLRFCPTRKCRQPSVLSMAVHFELTIRWAETWFLLVYPPAGSLPNPEHELHATCSDPPQREHGRVRSYDIAFNGRAKGP